MAQRLGAVYGGSGNIHQTKPDKFFGLITQEIYKKVKNDHELTLDELSKIFQYYVHRDKP